MTNAPIRRSLRRVAAATLCLLVVGCYDGDELVRRARSKALRTRAEEVSLGAFRVTLPRDPRTGEMVEIDVRLFGQSERYKINEIQAELSEKGPLLEDRVLRALREASRGELAEPDLQTLRGRLLETTNGLLTGSPLHDVGFADVRFTRH